MADVLVKENATIDDTIDFISKRIQIDCDSRFIGKMCEVLNASDPDRLSFLQRLQDYVHRNVAYVLDPAGKERVYKPTTTITNGVGDCKKMSVIIGSCLKRAGIPAMLKHVTYEGDAMTHIYVIVPYPSAKGYITLDPVNNPYFNNEVGHAEARTYDLNGNQMNVYTGNRSGKYSFTSGVSGTLNKGAFDVLEDISVIAGCGLLGATAEEQAMIADILSEEPEIIGGIGRKSKEEREKKKEERKEKRKKLLDKLKGKGLKPARAAVLTMVKKNFPKLADKFYRAWMKDKARTENFWISFGGDPLELKNAIIEGSGKTISGGTGSAALVAAGIIATATPIFIKAKDLFKSLGVLKSGEDEEMEDIIEQGEDEGSKPAFVVPMNMLNLTAVPSTVPASKGGEGSPSAGSFSPFMEVTSWMDVFYCGFKSGIYTAPIAWQFGTTAAGIVSIIGTLFTVRKFIAHKFTTVILKKKLIR